MGLFVYSGVAIYLSTFEQFGHCLSIPAEVQSSGSMRKNRQFDRIRDMEMDFTKKGYLNISRLGCKRLKDCEFTFRRYILRRMNNETIQ